MDFESVLSNSHTKKYLKETIDTNRIAHAQLFVGEEGVGTLPMASCFARLGMRIQLLSVPI